MRHWFTKSALAGAILALGVVQAGAVINDTTIYDIQAENLAIGDSVRVTNCVVIGVDIRPSTYGVYIQEQDGGPYSGVLAYRSGEFPAYDNSPDPVVIGDVVEVMGVINDFAGLTEIDGGTGLPSLDKLGSVTPLAPEVLPPDSLSNGYAGSERWEGVLVQVQNVEITSTNSFGNFYFRTASGLDSLSGYEKMFSGQVVPDVGDTLATLTGVADYAFNERRIAPRSNEDIVFLSPGPSPVPNLAYSSAENQIKVRFNVPLLEASAEDDLNYSLSTFENITSAVYNAATQTVTLTTDANLVPSTTPHTLSMSGIRNAQNTIMVGTQEISFIGGVATIPFVQDPVDAVNDTSKVNGQQVSFRGVVTAAGDGVDFPVGIGFYVQDRSAAEYAGIFVYGSPVTPAKGDSVFVSGIVTEFGVGPETEITSVDEVTILGSVAPIDPIDRTLAQISGSDPAEAEKYESALVRVQGVESITQATYPGDPFSVVQGTLLKSGDMVTLVQDTILVDDLAIDERAYQSVPGDILDVTGLIRFSGTAPFRRLQPRNWNEPPVGDIDVISKSATDAPPAAFATTLQQNRPNPFNPVTEIAFTLGQSGRATLRVYDLHGRLVTTLIDREMEAGPGRVTWNGRDQNGRSVGSGIYFYRLIAGDQEKTRKMVVLK